MKPGKKLKPDTRRIHSIKFA